MNARFQTRPDPKKRDKTERWYENKRNVDACKKQILKIWLITQDKEETQKPETVNAMRTIND